MKCECGRGLLAADRKNGVCGRCGNLIPPRLLPPSARFWKPQQVSAFKKGRVYIGSDVPIFNCLACNRGDHDSCEQESKQFCECYREGHNSDGLRGELDTGRGGIRQGNSDHNKISSIKPVTSSKFRGRRQEVEVGEGSISGRRSANQVQVVEDEEEEFF